jgi:uncharacterized protein YqeY
MKDIGRQPSAAAHLALVSSPLAHGAPCEGMIGRMTLVDTLRKQALEAMKAKDSVATTILRLAQSEVQATEERAGRALTDDEAFAVVRKLVKSNDETLAASTASAADAEQRAILTRENQLLTALLPKGLSVAEIHGHLEAVRDAIRAASNDGQATGVAMKHLKSQGVTASGSDVGQAVKALRAG